MPYNGLHEFSTIVRRSGNPPSSTIGGLRYVQSVNRALQLICKRAPDIVAMECVKFEQPIEGYLVLLLDGQRVFSRLQLNVVDAAARPSGAPDI